ncbi:hypothetical protein X797_002206 [Metarhizium robertsii]|uniref:Uncharacterized protein n=1 Tax=Metarhizium robertsii TaxID=568076 RepID=A0A0A1V3X9_9HYPO|nr:hypothetical protein X797_002206 [Metarhizium robertsii]
MTPRPAERRRLLVRKTRGLESGSLATNKLATHVVCVLRTASPELALQPSYQLLRSTPVTSLSRVRIPGLPHWVPQRPPVSTKMDKSHAYPTLGPVAPFTGTTTDAVLRCAHKNVLEWPIRPASCKMHVGYVGSAASLQQS